MGDGRNQIQMEGLPLLNPREVMGCGAFCIDALPDLVKKLCWKRVASITLMDGLGKCFGPWGTEGC